MPSKPGKICACGAKVASGDLCKCQREANRKRKARFDATRPSASQRGYGLKWREARVAFLAVNRTCRMCGEPATVVDHIVPHKGDFSKGGLFWNRRNWQPLCRHCHNSVKQSNERQGDPGVNVNGEAHLRVPSTSSRTIPMKPT